MSRVRELADTVIRKFIKTFLVSEWDVETDTGWQPVNSVSMTIPYEVWRVTTSTGKILDCADDHILFDNDQDQLFAKDSCGEFIMTVDGPEQVVSVCRVGEPENMYDLEIDSDDHRFYTNDILSHNSITTCSFLLWTVLFHDSQNIAILANKYKTAQKLLSDLKKSYMGLPKWLQQGVVEWNKGNIVLENGCQITANSTASDAIRGNSYNLIFLDEFAFVPSHIADDFFDSVYPTISSGDTSKLIIVSTPKGMNKFHKMWVEANYPKDSEDETMQWNGYVPFQINWRDVPGRTEAWKKETISRTNLAQFSQEFESVFGDVYIQVQDNTTGLISNVQIQDLYEHFQQLNEGTTDQIVLG